MITCLTIAVVGSRLRVVGAIAASVLVVGLPEWTRALRETYLLAYGVILLVVMILAPEGLMVAAERLAARLLPSRRLVISAIVEAPLAVPMSSEALLEISDIFRSFGGVRALGGASLAVRAGEVVGLVGPNGSGKTTLLNAVSGLSPAQSGRIMFEGQDIGRRLPHLIARSGLARSFQVPTLIDDMTAIDNVAIACAPGVATGLLALMGAGAAAVSLCGALPTAMRRRVEIARALSLQPRLLMLDEPAAGFSESEQDDLSARLRTVASRGVALLIVEHDMAFLAKLADRLVCLDGGRVIAEGPPSIVLADPAVIAAYLGQPQR
jgi:branched-chain amino acid transport system permease protein